MFQVNWFRRDADGKFIWPGFGENLRVLRWVRDQVLGRNPQGARETAAGIVPTAAGLDTSGLGLSANAVEDLLSVSRQEWIEEAEGQGSFLQQFGGHFPCGAERPTPGARRSPRDSGRFALNRSCCAILTKRTGPLASTEQPRGTSADKPVTRSARLILAIGAELTEKKSSRAGVLRNSLSR